jgi:hypothetical protein
MPLWPTGGKAGLPPLEVAERTGGVNNPNLAVVPASRAASAGYPDGAMAGFLMMREEARPPKGSKAPR